MTVRPLLKHTRDHEVLFSEIARLSDIAVKNLELKNYGFHKIPKLVTDQGDRLSIEPERSIVVPNYTLLQGVLPMLEESIPGFSMVPNSEAGFRYPTAALAGKDAPFIKRMRSEYFHRVDEDRSICRPVNLSFGIKSRGKSDNRLEYEVWVPDSAIDRNPLPLMVEKYGGDLPQSIRDFILQPATVYGWMGVKRAAFEALYHNPKELGDIVLCMSLSLDAYNVGARPDLSYCSEVESSIAMSQAEFEWEITGFYAPEGEVQNVDMLWSGIRYALAAVAEPLEDIFGSIIIRTDQNKTERILNTVENLGISVDYVKCLNLQPEEFLKTSSDHRVKSHDPKRCINLLGRLNRLFYQPQHKLPSINRLHDVIALVP